MRIVVLGATGHTGRHVLDLALRRGHEVTAFARSPGKLAPAERLTIVLGNRWSRRHSPPRCPATTP